MKRDGGSTTVEFALTAPLVLLLLLGILDFGRALNAYVTVGNAAREGLRYAARDPRAAADVAGEVAKRTVPLDPDLLEVTAEYSNDGGVTWTSWNNGGTGAIEAGMTVVRVEVSYPWAASTTLIGGFFEGGTGGRTFTARSTGLAETTRR